VQVLTVPCHQLFVAIDGQTVFDIHVQHTLRRRQRSRARHAP
jgi:hypothetical protein